MTTVSSRVQFLPVPVAHPGICVLCGAANKAVVDFGKKIERYGRVYFCEDCIKEVSLAIGYIPVAGFDQLHTAYRELQVKYDQLEAKYKAVTSDVFKSLVSDHGNSNVTPDIVILDVPDVAVSEANVVDNDESVSGDSKAEQSASVEGIDDLFDSSDFDD